MTFTVTFDNNTQLFSLLKKTNSKVIRSIESGILKVTSESALKSPSMTHWSNKTDKSVGDVQNKRLRMTRSTSSDAKCIRMAGLIAKPVESRRWVVAVYWREVWWWRQRERLWNFVGEGLFFCSTGKSRMKKWAPYRNATLAKWTTSRERWWIWRISIGCGCRRPKPRWLWRTGRPPTLTQTTLRISCGYITTSYCSLSSEPTSAIW